MIHAARQAWRGAGMAMLVCCMVAVTAARADQSPATAPAGAGDVDEQALRGVCDALVDSAVRRPYGWAWSDRAIGAGGRPTAAAAANVTIDVSMEPSVTPAAGLVLYHAGRRLDEPRYAQAALEVARGVAAAQDSTGRIPAAASFGRSASGTDPPAAVPDRGPTRAALGLLLTLLGDDAGPLAGEDAATRESLRRAARRAGYWLLKQQAKSAAWPLAYPPDAPPGKAKRVLRLDLPDYRLSTIALLLAGNVLDDHPLRFNGGRSVEHLLSLRAVDVKSGRGLWGTAYHLGGGFDNKTLPDAAPVDLQATREAMLTLLNGYLLTTDGTALVALQDAAGALRALEAEERLAVRFPGRRPEQPSTAPAGPFTREIDPTTQPWRPDDMTELLRLVDQLQQAGRDAAASALASPLTLEQHLCAELCELSVDGPLPRASVESANATEDHQPRGARRIIGDAWRALAARTRK